MSTDPESTSREAPEQADSGLGVEVGGVRGRIATALGIRRGMRERVVRAMIRRPVGHDAGYWLQLVLATGIASLGLSLNSTGVVIGAMLVSPLMTPIVETGMGLAVGSVYLATRSAIRVAFSVGIVVGGAAALTRALPFHEITTEIQGRTSPTLIDLGVAIFCALAAAYTTFRADSSTASAAAGTAISIALVPPLAVVGFGLATARWPVAYGSALLFVANLSAIVVGSIALFLAVGFDRVEPRALDARLVPSSESTAALDDRIRRFAPGRSGRIVRLILPALFLASVFVPLRRALREVAWQVRARSSATDIVRSATGARQVVRQAVSIDGRRITVRVVLVGRSPAAVSVEREIRTRLTSATGRVPDVGVVAVPSASALDDVEALAGSPAPRESAAWVFDVDGVRDRAAAALDRHWPSASAGRLLTWRFFIDQAAAVHLQVTHIGAPLGRSGAEILGAVLSEDLALSRGLSVDDDAIDSDVHALGATSTADWLLGLGRAADMGRRLADLWLCVTRPPPPSEVVRSGLPALHDAGVIPRLAPDAAALASAPGLTDHGFADAVSREISRVPVSRSATRLGPTWAYVLSVEPCPDTVEAARDGGVAGDASRDDVSRASVP